MTSNMNIKDERTKPGGNERKTNRKNEFAELLQLKQFD